jgi:hypothetical protein
MFRCLLIVLAATLAPAATPQEYRLGVSISTSNGDIARGCYLEKHISNGNQYRVSVILTKETVVTCNSQTGTPLIERISRTYEIGGGERLGCASESVMGSQCSTSRGWAINSVQRLP